MAKLALGRRAPCGAVSVADSRRITNCFCLGDRRLKAFEGQLTGIGVQLPGPLAMESMPQLGHHAILTFGLGRQAYNFGLTGHKRLPHTWRKRIQIKGVRARRGHVGSYRIRHKSPNLQADPRPSVAAGMAVRGA